MSTQISRKKKMRQLQRTSATRLERTVTELLVSFDSNRLEEFLPRLNQLKMSMQEKLEILKVLHEEILNLVDEDSIDEEIEQCHICRENLQLALENIEGALHPHIQPVHINHPIQPVHIAGGPTHQRIVRL